MSEAKIVPAGTSISADSQSTLELKAACDCDEYMDHVTFLSGWLSLVGLANPELKSDFQAIFRRLGDQFPHNGAPLAIELLSIAAQEVG